MSSSGQQTPLQLLTEPATAPTAPTAPAAPKPLELMTAATAATASVIAAAAEGGAKPSIDALIAAYEQNFYYNLFYVVILTIVLVVILFTVFIGGSIADVARNWPSYRCNPIIMPFASLYGYNASDNFNFCMKSIFNANTAAVMGPIYGLMSGFTDIAGNIANSANSFRYLIANLLNGMDRLMSGYRDRFQFILFTIRMSFLKIKSLMGRLYGTFYSVIFMALSGLTAAKNLAFNDLVMFLLEFCFDPETPIELADGSVKKLHSVVIGDKLKAVDSVEPVVTSIFTFDGSATPMVRIGDTLVSREHFTFYKEEWIKAGDHPDAISAESIPALTCINTTTHVFTVRGVIFADYDESSDPTVVTVTQSLAEMLLNGGLHGDGCEATADYELGISGMMPVVLYDGTALPLASVKIGDKLLGGGVVQGLVQEKCNWLVTLPNGHKVSGSQLLWDPNFSMWRRAALVHPEACIKSEGVVLHQLTVSNNIIESVDCIFRDYREVNEPDMEKAYENSLTKKLSGEPTNEIM